MVYAFYRVLYRHYITSTHFITFPLNQGEIYQTGVLESPDPPVLPWRRCVCQTTLVPVNKALWAFFCQNVVIKKENAYLQHS